MPKLTSKKTRKSRLETPYSQDSTNKNDELLKILETGNTIIELISASSLSGFIFKIANNMKSYIMKIIVLTDVEKKYLLKCMQMVPSLSNRKRKKMTEIKKDFVYESEIQNFIHNESKRGGRTPICPEVTYTKIYDNHLSQHFLKLLRYKTTQNNNNAELNRVIECLQQYFNEVTRNTLDQYNKPYYKLGIILMPEVENSITLDKVANGDLNITDNHIYPQIIYLFLIIGIINFDMHEGNILISNENGVITTKLIDFGKVDNLKNVENGVFLTANEKTYINEIRKTLNDELHKIAFDTTTNNETKHNFIMKTMNIINLISWIINKRTKGVHFSTPEGHQMDWFEPIKDVSEFMYTYHNYYKQNINTINANNLNYIINLLLNYDYYNDSQYKYVNSFELLKNNYITESTRSNTYRNVPVVELTLSDYNMTKELDGEMPERSTNSVQPEQCANENNITCAISGGRKKSTKKNITRKSIRKPIHRPIRKSQKKIIRKSKKK
uniref:Uncharacterized protein n=1 Tax=viral metagenome TaxID=1070528 RepID=A0A6C0E859_9ZZZZ